MLTAGTFLGRAYELFWVDILFLFFAKAEKYQDPSLKMNPEHKDHKIVSPHNHVGICNVLSECYSKKSLRWDCFLAAESNTHVDPVTRGLQVGKCRMTGIESVSDFGDKNGRFRVIYDIRRLIKHMREFPVIIVLSLYRCIIHLYTRTKFYFTYR